jgi:nucleoside-diphosphate-sugar epimerase
MHAISADLGQDGEWIGEVARFSPEWCLHLAWEGLPDYSLERCRANLDAGIRLLRTVAQSGVKRMVVAGSCWEFGRAAGAVPEDTVPVDTGVFASTKRALQTVLDSVARESAFEYRWARVFFVYGAGQRPTSLIPHLRAAYAAGRTPDIREPAAVQDFVHVDDVAAALVALAASDGPSGIFNIGTGQATSVGHVANQVAAFYDRTPPFEFVQEGPGFWADTHKMRSVTGWRARIGIDEGIRKVLTTLDGGG